MPDWLAQRMTLLGTAIAESIVIEYGASELLARLSDPFWFQAFGSVMGMDWHSSGITTSVLGALKRGLNPRARELGITLCGGRGKQSLKTPAELRHVAEKTGVDGENLVRLSRLTARVDNNALRDGFQIYLHSFIVTDRGEWAVVQQGLNDGTGMARRYHWHSAAVRDFVDEPHTGIIGEPQGAIVNLVDHRARSAQQKILGITREHPERTLTEVKRLVMPRHHHVRAENVNLKRLGATLAAAYERDLHDFAELLLVEKMGPRTLETLAMIAEVIHGTPSRFQDPARYSFALGGKDRHPFPVPLKVYDQSISLLRSALDRARVGDREKLSAFQRLDRFVTRVEEQCDTEVDLAALVRHEEAIAPALGGRSILDDRRPRQPRPQQFNLFQGWE